MAIIVKFREKGPRKLTQAEVISNLQDRIIKVCSELEYNALEFAFMIHFDDIELVEKVLAKKAYPTITMLNNIIKYLGVSKLWLLDSDNYRLNFTLKNIASDGLFKNVMFQPRPLTNTKGVSIKNLCLQENFRHIILIVENFNETDNPRAMFVLEKNDVYQIVNVFNFFDISSALTQCYLKEILEFCNPPFPFDCNFLIRSISSKDFDTILERNNHIGKYLIKAPLDYTDDTRKYMDMIFNKELKEMMFDEMPDSQTKDKVKKILEFLEQSKAEAKNARL